MSLFFYRSKKKGFTLVEILVVIVLVGILAGLISLVVHSSLDGAEASKIISDLRNIKSAVHSYAMDTGWPDPLALSSDFSEKIDGYLDRPIFGSDGWPPQYTLVMRNADGPDGRQLVGIKPASGNFSLPVIRKLAQQAKTAGLYAGSPPAQFPGSAGNNVDYVLMYVK